MVPETDRLVELVCAHRANDAATKPSLRPVACAPGGKAGRLEGPRVIGRNDRTYIPPPVGKLPASSSKSSECGTYGRSSRSSRRPGKPATWPRGADVTLGLPNGETPVDSGEQADTAWLLDIQRKLYTWSRNHPEEAWKDIWGWLTSSQNLRLAWRRVAHNKGARSAGVDKVTVRHIKERVGVERFLRDLRQRLKTGRYSPVSC